MFNVVDQDTNSSAASKEDPSRIPWATVLAKHPPGRQYEVADIAEYPPGIDMLMLSRPVVNLECQSRQCRREMSFDCQTDWRDLPSLSDNWSDYFFSYRCRNCRETEKKYAVTARLLEGMNGQARKLGEWPPYGPRVPSRLVTLLKPDRELFLSGRRAESQGFGIGAFAYYRRVVENQKGRLFDELIRAAKRLDAPETLIEELQSAKRKTQFGKAIQTIRSSLPESLLISGHNPLTLLHSALSHNLHTETDQKCLDAARDIRVVLTEFAERCAEVLRNRAELDAAVNRLR